MSIDDPDRDRDLADLLEALAGVEDAQQRIPCRSIPLPERRTWVSDDPGEQRLAARLCQDCPGREPCAAYIHRHPKEHGVYGAVTDADRKPPVGRPRKE